MHFEAYDSMEAMFDAMTEAENAANERATDQQRRLTFGDHWFRPMGPDYGYMWIFGRILTVEQLLASELLGVTEYAGGTARRIAVAKATDLLATAGIDADTDTPLADGLAGHIDLAAPMGKLHDYLEARRDWWDIDADTWEEWASVAYTTADSYRRGYRFGKAYSLAEPSGEYGSTHISEMCPSTAAEFSDAEQAGWDFAALIRPDGNHRAEWAINLAITGTTLDQLHRREV